MTEEQFIQWLDDATWSCDDWFARNGSLIHRPTGRTLECGKQSFYMYRGEPRYSYHVDFDGFRFWVKQTLYDRIHRMTLEKLTHPREEIPDTTP